MTDSQTEVTEGQPFCKSRFIIRHNLDFQQGRLNFLQGGLDFWQVGLNFWQVGLDFWQVGLVYLP